MKKAITVMLLLILAISSAGFDVSAAYDDRSDQREHDRHFRNSLIVDGVDVSSYQDDDIDWEAAEAQVRKSLSGSKVRKVQIKVGTATENKKFVKKYKKVFKKKIVGAKVTVK